ncbi:MAG: hypothetical protein COV44_02360 [Deltaproteobacteria bacterium CG11_big_fil_rev_8_21_14_0_20_45_16]|nr:MAG: hypothetical protein COV44_02360 [Deltaproteobacteria bacterium CG11_big_fil_rev_8_21_14_0_20_45_16]
MSGEGRRYLFVGVLVGLLTACSNSVYLPVDEPAPNLNATGEENSQLSESVQLFSQTLFPLLEQNCAGCHGSLQSPFFAQPTDIQNSHDIIVDGALVNFADPRSSRIVERVYFGHNCFSDNCATDGNLLLAAIEDWKTQLGEVSGGLQGIVTDPVTVPVNLENDPETGYPIMSFDIGGITSEVPSGSKIEFRISAFTEDTYLISDILLYSSQDIYIKNISLYINEQKGEAASLELVDGVILSDFVSGSLIIEGSVFGSMGLGIGEGQPSGPGVDKIQLGFELIGDAPDPQALRFAAFQQLIANECAGCHSGSRPTDFGGPVTAFPLFTTEAQYLNAPTYGTFDGLPESPPRHLVVAGDPESSGIYRAVAHGTPGHSYAEYNAGGVAENAQMKNVGSINERTQWAQIVADWINGL